MILRCHPREIFGLVDEIKRLRERLAAVEALCDQRQAERGNRMFYGGTPAPAWLTVDEVRAAARGEADRG